MVPPYSVWISRVRTYSGFRSLRSRFDYRAFTFFGWASHPILLRLLLLFPVRTPGVLLPPVWPLSLSLATTHEISVDVSSSAYLDVSVREVPRVYLCIQYTLRDSSSRGFPHSDICGSQAICASPQLFAAYRVLLRLLMPRHSPCALLSLNFFPSLLHEFRKSVIFLLIAVYCFQYYFALFFGKTIIFFTQFLLSFLLSCFFCFRIPLSRYTVCSICFLLFCCHCPLGSLSADIP